MITYVISISKTDSTHSDNHLFHKDLYNDMPYYSARKPYITEVLKMIFCHMCFINGIR